jgi:hypothetical protein
MDGKHRNILVAYANGEYSRRDEPQTGKGVLFVKDESCSFLFPSEFPQKDFARQLQDAIGDQNDRIFIVEEKEKKYNVYTYPKATVLSEIACTNALPDEAGSSTGGTGSPSGDR